MTVTISATEARRKLHKILQELEQHPERTFQITLRHRIVAEMRAVKTKAKSGQLGQKLLALARELEKEESKPQT
ncbi:MAG: hypothetical protein Q9P14_03605, partial [candidate division KSB1 bacterium]|nr:hypothetical protein [candidate division KSB1 bacterium]